MFLLGLSLNQWAVLQAWAPRAGLKPAQDGDSALTLLGEWEQRFGQPPADPPLIVAVDRPADRPAACALFRAVAMECPR